MRGYSTLGAYATLPTPRELVQHHFAWGQLARGLRVVQPCTYTPDEPIANQNSMWVRITYIDGISSPKTSFN
jgi:hypothetical protein